MIMGSIENGVSRDAERDRQAKEAYKRKKKENDERSEFSDEMSSLYRKCASLAMKMIKFDRTRLNIEVVNKNVIDKSKDKYGPFIKPKGKCFTSSALCSEHFRKFEFKGVKSSTGETVVKPMVMKVVFSDFVDKNGNPSPRMKGLIDGIYALQAEKIIVELSRIIQFCRFFLETMKDNIVRFYGMKSPEYRFYQKCYTENLKLSSKYKNLAKQFSKRAHTDIKGEDGEDIQYSEKVNFFLKNKLDEDEEISYAHETRAEEWEIKLQKIKEKNKEISKIIEKHTYSKPANNSLKELNKFSIKVGTKYKNRFTAIEETARDKEQAKAFIKDFKDNKKEDKSFYAAAQVKVDKEFKKLQDELKELAKGEEELRKFIKSKEELNKELDGKSDEEKLKWCTNYLSIMKKGIRELNEIYRLYGRAVENTNNYLIEMNNLTNTEKWKNWIKDEVKPMLKGHARMLKLRRANKKAAKKEEARRKQEEREKEEEEARKRKAAADKAAADKAAADKAAADKAAADKAAADKVAADKAAATAATAEEAADEAADSGGAVLAGESSSSSSADSPEGGAPSTKPLPKRP